MNEQSWRGNVHTNKGLGGENLHTNEETNSKGYIHTNEETNSKSGGTYIRTHEETNIFEGGCTYEQTSKSGNKHTVGLISC